MRLYVRNKMCIEITLKGTQCSRDPVYDGRCTQHYTMYTSKLYHQQAFDTSSELKILRQQGQQDSAKIAKLEKKLSQQQIDTVSAKKKYDSDIQALRNEAQVKNEELRRARQSQRDLTINLRNSKANQGKLLAQTKHIKELLNQQKEYEERIKIMNDVSVILCATALCLSGVIVKMGVQIEELKHTVDSQKKRISTLCNKLKQESEEKESLKQELEKQKNTIKNVTFIYEELVYSLEQEKLELISRNVELSACLASSQDALNEMKESADLDNSSEIIGDLNNLVAELRSQNNELSAEIKKLTEERDMIAAECVELKERAEIAEAALAAVVVAVVAAIVLAGIMSAFRRNGDKVQMPSFSGSRTKIVIENERYYPFVGWTKSLLVTDRSAYTEFDGSTKSPAPANYPLEYGYVWDGNWEVCKCESVDGWLYALDFPREYYTENFPTACVRRRIHARNFKLSGIDMKRTELFAGQSLLRGEKIESSEYTLIHQTDGNVVVYNIDNKPLWATNTNGKPSLLFTLQEDGNLVLYDINNKPLWDSKTNGKSSFSLSIGSSGKLVIMSKNMTLVWSSS